MKISSALAASDTPICQTSAVPVQNTDTTEYLTQDDLKTLDQMYGANSLAELEANPDSRTFAENIGRMRESGAIVGSLQKYVPAANLTSSDQVLLEQLTGQATVAAAISSSQDAASLALNIGMARQQGTLTGALTATFLEGFLPASAQAASSGEGRTLVSSTFVEKAIAALSDSSHNMAQEINLDAIA